MAAESCPGSWPVLHPGPPVDAFDAAVSVLAGGDLTVAGGASGAEGVVVALGDATFALATPGSYQVGVTDLGSQVAPYAGSDMLVVGGTLVGALGTRVDVGVGLGGDAVVGGQVVDGSDLDAHGGAVDDRVPDATAPYDTLPDVVSRASAEYAALVPTGTAEPTDTALTLTGDAMSDPQVFSVDGATLGGVGRSLQLLDVPDGAAVVVNLTGPAVDLDVDALLAPTGAVVDPLADAYFPALATHLLWNAPDATTVDVGGLAQLPGSLLVPTRASTTMLSGAGTNGRVLVGGDLVQAGVGSQLHSYPFLPDGDLGCRAPAVRLGSLTVTAEIEDPDDLLPDGRVFTGRYACDLDDADVTPADDTWAARADGSAVLLSDALPVGAVCTLTEDAGGSSVVEGRDWAEPTIRPDHVVVATREVRGFTATNRILPAVEPTPSPAPGPSATVTPTPPAPSVAAPEPSPVPTRAPTPTPAPTASPRPSGSVTAAPSADPTTSGATPSAAPGPAPEASGGAPVEPLPPFTLRGAFVWGPLLMLSLLTMLLRVRRPSSPSQPPG